MNCFDGIGTDLSNLWRLSNAETRSISPENPTGEKGSGGMAEPGVGTVSKQARDLGLGWKLNPYILIEAGETVIGLA